MAAPPHSRAAAMLAAATGEPAADVASLPIDERDARLFALRERTFGTRIAAVVSCAACGEPIEFECESRDLVGDAPGVGVSGTLTIGGRAIELRAPDSRDQEDAAAAGDLEGARRLLLTRCAPSLSFDELTPAAIQEIDARLAAMHPHADIRVAMTCPACASSVELPFDIASYFWHEITAAAARLLQDVHVLARAYGWSERDILAMSPIRRHAYLETAGA